MFCEPAGVIYGQFQRKCHSCSHHSEDNPLFGKWRREGNMIGHSCRAWCQTLVQHSFLRQNTVAREWRQRGRKTWQWQRLEEERRISAVGNHSIQWQWYSPNMKNHMLPWKVLKSRHGLLRLSLNGISEIWLVFIVGGEDQSKNRQGVFDCCCRIFIVPSKEHRYAPIVQCTGLFVGHHFLLRWDHVDWMNRFYFYVRLLLLIAASRVSSRLITRATKNARIRVFPVPSR